MKKRILAAMLAILMAAGNTGYAFAGDENSSEAQEVSEESSEDKQAEDSSENSSKDKKEDSSENSSKDKKEDSSENSSKDKKEDSSENSSKNKKEDSSEKSSDDSEDNSDAESKEEEKSKSEQESEPEQEEKSVPGSDQEQEDEEKSVPGSDQEQEDEEQSALGSDEGSENKSETGTETESRSETESEIESESESDSADGDKKEKLVWASGYAPMIQSGDFVAEHFKADGDGSGASSSSSSKTANKLRKETAFTSQEEAVEALRPVFAAAFKNCQSTVDISDYEIYIKDDASDDSVLDGIAILTEAYQSAVSGEEFYITGYFDYAYSKDSGKIEKVIIGYGSSFVGDSYISQGKSELKEPDTDVIAKAQKTFEQAVEQAKSVASEGSNDLEKALLLHDYIVEQCDYDYGNTNSSGEYPDDDYTAYGVLVNHTAVCNGYAFAYSLILQDLGIDSYIMASDSMNHAWNLVKLGDEWYHVDSTRDDNIFANGLTYYSLGNADSADEGFVSHKYFLRSDSEMTGFAYNNWARQASSSSVPKADDSDTYSSYIFRKYLCGACMKIDGSWYLGSLEKRQIFKISDLSSSSASVLYSADDLMYALDDDSCIYFNRADGVYRLEPASGTVKAVLQTTDEGKTVSEMGIKGGKLVIKILNSDGSTQSQSVSLDDLTLYTIPGQTKISSTSASSKGLKLCWTGVDASDGYSLYVSESKSGTYTKLADISGSSVTSYEYQPGDVTKRYYKIRSYKKYSSATIYSDLSDAVSGQLSNGWVELSDGGKKYYKNGKAVSGLIKISGSYYYFDETTNLMKTGWVRISSKRYYFDKESGAALTGWQVIRGKGYYFSKKTAAAFTGSHKFSGKKYTFNSSGVLKKAPYRALVGGFYFKKNGVPQKGWHTIAGKKYYFSKSSYKMYTGMHTINGTYYCFYDSGKRRTGFVTLDGIRRYFSKKTGKMYKGWHTINGKKYYFDKKTGAQLSGLQKIGSYTYYLYKNGGRATGMVTISGKKYFFKSNGRLDTGWSEGSNGGMQYVVDGKPLTGIQTVNGLEYYFDSNGYVQTGLVTISGKTYYFKSSGGRVKDSYITLKNSDGTKKLAYFDADGVRYTGTKTIDGNTWYFVANDGKLTGTQKRQAVVTMALSYLRTKKGSDAHHKIINTYNSIKSKYKVSYTMSYSDAWCAATVSAFGAMCNMSSLVLPECSCPRMIQNYKKIGRWVENDAYVPEIGDIVMYDWGDSGSGDNKGVADHVGLVIKVYKSNGKTYFRVIEGNCVFNNNTGNTITSAEKAAGKGLDNVTYFRGVGIRTMQVNGRYIRGFCRPKY